MHLTLGATRSGLRAGLIDTIKPMHGDAVRKLPGLTHYHIIHQSCCRDTANSSASSSSSSSTLLT